MKKKKYSKKEKERIISEISRTNKVHSIAEKYNLHASTIYRWISILTENNNRTIEIKTYLTTKEYESLLKRIEDTVYKKHIGKYLRTLIFNKNIVLADPQKLIKELYLTRAELNKIGSNLNQMANYTNFLMNNNYIEIDTVENIYKEIGEAQKLFAIWQSDVDGAFTKIK